MPFEPGKFFIGIIDFFSIMLPGAILAFVFKVTVGPRVLGMLYYSMTPAEGWTVFLVFAYLLGHFIFLIGSAILDDRVYDPLRAATVAQLERRLAEGEHPPRRLTRWLARWMLREKGKSPLAIAEAIKRHYVEPIGDPGTVNAFQWSKAMLAVGHPDSLAMVEGFEASSKFFRSLCVVLFVTMVWALRERRFDAAAASAIGLVLGFVRYKDQRSKSTQQAYWNVMAIESLKGKYALSRPPDAPTHAGGVVVRQNDMGEQSVLFVRAKGTTDQWVLPKGHIERGEPAERAAVREVREESGEWARVIESLGVARVPAARGPGRATHFFLMVREARAGKAEEHRDPEWVGLDAAVDRATFADQREVVRSALHRVRGLDLNKR
jgi:8-oxo-dGTP pyrophosphatase MutT (NUDIX family)